MTLHELDHGFPSRERSHCQTTSPTNPSGSVRRAAKGTPTRGGDDGSVSAPGSATFTTAMATVTSASTAVSGSPLKSLPSRTDTTTVNSSAWVS